MKLLITGASGQLARRTTELLLERISPADLILASRKPEALSELEHRGVEVRFCDFANPETLPAAFAGASKVLLVSISELTNRAELHAAAIDAAVAAGVEHIAYTSGLAPGPPNPAIVAPSHFATEQRLASADVTWTILRNSLYAEYQATEAANAAETGRLVHNRGDGRVAYVSREDCARAAAAALVSGESHNAIYDITGPQSFDAARLCVLYGELSGRTVDAVALDDEAFVSMLAGGGEDEHSKYGAELVASFGRSIREGFMDSCTDHVTRLTGNPARSLRDVLLAAD